MGILFIVPACRMTYYKCMSMSQYLQILYFTNIHSPFLTQFVNKEVRNYYDKAHVYEVVYDVMYNEGETRRKKRGQ